MAEDTLAFSGEIPRNYDRDLGPITVAGYAADMARRAASGGMTAHVLETAAGSGIVTRALRDALPATAHLTATDFNPDMLEIAREKFRADEAVTFQQADAMKLPFPDNSFDTVICHFGVMFYPDKNRGYREVYRVLAPRGRYLFNVWDAHRHNVFGRIAHEVIGSFFPTDPPTFMAAPFSYHLIDPIKESLLAADFENIVVSVVQLRRSVTDLRSFAHGFVYGTPALNEIRQRGLAEPSQLQQALEEAMRREFGAEPTTISIQTIMFEAQKPQSGPAGAFAERQ